MRKSGDMIRDQVRILYLLFLWVVRDLFCSFAFGWQARIANKGHVQYLGQASLYSKGFDK